MDASETHEAPIWAAPEVYPAKSSVAPFGALSRKQRRREFQSFEALAAHVSGSRESVAAVWTPETGRMAPPEAVPELLEPLRQRFLDLADRDAADARRNSIIFLFLLGWTVMAAVSKGIAPHDSPTVGLAALLLLVLGLVPWYDALKGRREAWKLDETMLPREEADARFDYWLGKQRGWLTIILLACLGLAGGCQVWVGLEESAGSAGLVKGRYFAGESWRLLTAPFLHGHPLHWVLNAGGLWYLGRRVEALAGWPHLAMVFLGAMLCGGVATAHLAPGRPSLGASGGLLGLLGFLLVFETLHPRLVPHPSRRRLAAALAVTFLAGFVGYRFIDNYAHGGGLAGGMIYAGVVYPRSRSARRPRPTGTDMGLGAAAVLVLTGSALLAAGLMLAS